MILLIGPLHGGKRDYACALLGCGRDELGRYACWDVQERAAGCENLEALARELSAWPRGHCHGNRRRGGAVGRGRAGGAGGGRAAAVFAGPAG